MTEEIPPPTKLTATKQRWAQEGRFLVGRSARPDSERLPPGQHLVRDWPVLDLGLTPKIAPARWSLRVYGAVAEAMTLDWATYQNLPQVQEVSDIHCVTTWSRYDNEWEGVSTRTLLDAVRPMAEADFVVLHSHDGYTTNLPMADFAAPGAILAHAWQGKPLTAEHGGPVRLIVPHLYLWKSAKWLERIEIRVGDAPGYWEVRGYHDRGDPWQEQRYSE
jgi:DMSO/TMAO reductase YedYZ molybdopterin-dependent catalytic subunit